MNKKLTRSILLLACFSLAHKNLKAQSVAPELVADPKAIFQSAVDKPINYYSGSATVTVPISNDVPVALSYNTTGIKPEQASGAVGLGWNLQGGGEIRRIQRGLPDEVTNRQTGDQGRFKPYPRVVDPYVFTLLNTTPQNNSSINTYFNQTSPSLTNSKNYDLAPDEFSYDVAGHSGRFYFTQSGTVLNNDNVTVEVRYQLDNRQSPFAFDGSAVQITRFILTFNDGVKCYFDNIDEFQIGNSLPIYSPNYRYYSECGAVNTSYGDIDHTNNYADSWKITKIVYPFDNLPLVYEYEKSTNVDALRHGRDILYYYYVDKAARTGYHDNNTGEVLNACGSAINKSRLKSISKGKYRVDFLYVTDASFTNTYHNFTLEWISEIRIIGLNGEPLKRYVLTHNRTSARRHLLTQIDILPGDGQAFPKLGKYKFDYDMTSMPDFEYLPGMLGNTAPVVQPITNTCGVDMYGYFNGVTSSYKSLVSVDASRAAAAFAQSPIQQSRTPNANTVQALSLKKVTYPAGGSIQYTYEPNTYSYVSNVATNSIKVGGGIRVKEVRISDGLDATKDVIKKIEYVAIADNSLSSGVIENEPLFEYRYISPASAVRQEFWLDMFSPDSWLPTGIGYEQVIEKSSDGGKTIYQFTTSKDYPHEEVMDSYPGIGKYVMQYQYYTSSGGTTTSVRAPEYRLTHKVNHYFNYTEGRYDYMRGLLKAKSLFDGSNRPVSSSNYVYIANEIGVIPSILITPLYGYRGPLSSTFTNNTNVPNTPGQYLAYDVYHDRLPSYMGMMNITNVVVGKPLVSQATSRTYDVSDPTKFYETVITNTYNRYYNRISSTKTTDSQGREVIEEFKCNSDYLTSADNNSLNVLTAKNILNKPVEILRKVNGKIISGALYEYNSDGLQINYYSLKINQNNPISLQPTINNFKVNINSYTKEAAYIYSATTKKLLTEIKPGNVYKSTLWTYGQFPCAAIEGTDLAETRSVDVLTSASTTINPGSSAVTIYSLTNPQNTEVGLHIKIAKTDLNKCSDFLTLVFSHDGKPFYSEHFNSDDRCVAENDVTLSFDLPAGYCTISATMPPSPGNSGGMSTSPVSIQIDPTETNVKRKAFYTSFEELSLNSVIINEGKTGSKSFNGSYLLPLPTQTGTYKVTYWEAIYVNNKLTGDWAYKEEVFSIPATTQKIIGSYNHPVDEIRIQPVNTLMTSSSLDRSFQLSAQNTPGNKIIHYEYDTFGRIVTVYDDNKNVIKSYDYHVKNQ